MVNRNVADFLSRTFLRDGVVIYPLIYPRQKDSSALSTTGTSVLVI
jgi:hypothetical protein